MRDAGTSLVLETDTFAASVADIGGGAAKWPRSITSMGDRDPWFANLADITEA
jgi:hypothetical protein